MMPRDDGPRDPLRCALPGSDLVEKRLEDLRAGRSMREALLVAIMDPPSFERAMVAASGPRPIP